VIDRGLSIRNILKQLAAALIVCCAGTGYLQAATPMLVTSDSQGNDYLLDTDGMTRKGYLVYVWQLQNLAQRNERGALSVRTQVEFDCRFRQSRVMWVSLYPELNEGGAVISSGMVANPEWVPAQPGAVEDSLIDYACRRIMR
jgi:hypothetical protein